MAKRIVLLGAPGSGKGTQATPLAAHCRIPHVSTGDIFRAAVAGGTPLGRQVQAYLDAGDLVPDGVTLAIVRERLEADDCAGGFVLDGFPRSLAQAEALDAELATMQAGLDHAICIKVGTYTLIKRLTSRRVCKSCGSSYNILFGPPRSPGVCDACGGELYQRADDQEDTIQNRLGVYMRETEPVVEYYDRVGLLRIVNGEQGLDEITAAMYAVVDH